MGDRLSNAELAALLQEAAMLPRVGERYNPERVRIYDGIRAEMAIRRSEALDANMTPADVEWVERLAGAPADVRPEEILTLLGVVIGAAGD